jgi:dihydropyrimidinase
MLTQAIVTSWFGATRHRGMSQAPWGAKVVDATGKYVMPGGIDPHTHLEMPFMGQVTCDDFFRCVQGSPRAGPMPCAQLDTPRVCCCSGQAAALAGGTTMHIDFALPVEHDLAAGFEAWKVGDWGWVPGVGARGGASMGLKCS